MDRPKAPAKSVSRTARRHTTADAVVPPVLNPDPKPSTDPAPIIKLRNESAAYILKKSAELFSQHGYDGVSVRDLAAACGVTLPTIYHYFGDKRKLYIEVCEQEFARANGAILAALNVPGKPAARLSSFVTALCELLTNNVQFSSLLQRELLDRDEELLKVTTNIAFMEEFRIVVDLVDLIDPGCNAKRVAFSIYGMAFGFVLLNPIGEVAMAGPLLPRDPKALARFILRLAFPQGH